MRHQDADLVTQARDTAFRLLTRREHSRAELHNKLTVRGYDSDVVNDLLTSLAAEDLVSDHRYAQALVAHRVNTGYGPQRIMMELKDKGVASEIIDQTLSLVEVDWDELLRVQHNRKFGVSKAGSFKEWSRRAQYLDRRGFNTDSIFRVMGSGDQATASRDDSDMDIDALKLVLFGKNFWITL